MRKALHRSLENKRGIPLIIFLSDEQFAGEASPDRLLFERSYFSLKSYSNNMQIKEHLDKNNLHHAYLIEGDRDKIVSEIFNFCEDINIKTSGNPDFCHITIDNLKIDEAFDLRSMSSNKAFSAVKKVFVVCVNSFSLDAQNVLLKMFEEPIENTHFFLVVPDVNALLKTLVSRFYFIKAAPMPEGVGAPTENIGERFIKMPLQQRIDFIKELLPKKDAENKEEISLESNNAKALKLLNALESVLHNKMSKMPFDIKFFEHFFKVRKFLRMPGASPKMLMESVALIIPEKV